MLESHIVCFNIASSLLVHIDTYTHTHLVFRCNRRSCCSSFPLFHFSSICPDLMRFRSLCVCILFIRFYNAFLVVERWPKVTWVTAHMPNHFNFLKYCFENVSDPECSCVYDWMQVIFLIFVFSTHRIHYDCWHIVRGSRENPSFIHFLCVGSYSCITKASNFHSLCVLVGNLFSFFSVSHFN